MTFEIMKQVSREIGALFLTNVADLLSIDFMTILILTISLILTIFGIYKTRIDIKSSDWPNIIGKVSSHGCSRFLGAIFNSVMKHKTDRFPSVIISRKRHKVSLEFARSCLERARNGISKKLPLELITIDIKDALNNIAEVAGETTPDDVLKKIFSDFCIGK